MKRNVLLAIVGASMLTASAAAQQLATKRIELQRHDLRFAGTEAIQARIDFAPGVAAPLHTHPGEEIIYVLSGTLEYRVGEASPVTLRAGDVLFVPDGVAHSARNVGDGPASELGTFIVDKGKPLLTVVE